MSELSERQDTIVAGGGYTLFEKGYFLAMVLVGMAVVGTAGWRVYDFTTTESYPDDIAYAVEAIEYGNREEAMAAADLLAFLGQETREAVDPLAAVARDVDAANRDIAILALGRLPGQAEETVPVLTYLFLDNDPAIRLAAVEAVGGIGLEAIQASPELIDVVLFDVDPQAARAAVVALGDIVAGDADSIEALVAALSNRNEGIRADAALTLGRIGSFAPEARERLLEMAETEDTEYVRIRAAWAAVKVDTETPSQDRDIATALLRDPEPRARSLAATELADLAQDDARAVASLIGALDDNKPSVRSEAAAALGWIANPGPEVVSALVETLDDPDPSVRGTAAWVLGELGADAAHAAPLLFELLDDPDPQVQQEACGALATIREATGKALEDADDNALFERVCGPY